MKQSIYYNIGNTMKVLLNIPMAIIATILSIYFAPTLLASRKKAPHATFVIGVIDVFFGWTLVGCLVAMYPALAIGKL